MKQAEIKVGRYYTRTNPLNVRYVTSISKGRNGSIITWQPPGTPRFTEVQRLKSFAQWAQQEVRPVYDAVVRCPKCDAWDWTTHIFDGRQHCCPECATKWNVYTGKVV